MVVGGVQQERPAPRPRARAQPVILEQRRIYALLIERPDTLFSFIKRFAAFVVKPVYAASCLLLHLLFA